MIARLVSDVLQRQAWMYLWISPLVFVNWVVAAVGEASIGKGLALSLAMVYGLGPITALSTANLRELRVLPVTNRELWLTMWTVSTVVSPLFMLIVQAAAVAVVFANSGATAVRPEAVILSFVYAFAYAGALVPVGPLLGYASGNIGSRKPRWLWSVLTTVCLLVLMGGFALPWLFAHSLPLALDQFTVLPAAGLAICLAITVASWAWTPTRGGIARPDQAAKRMDPARGAKSRPQFADRFTGISRIVWPQAALTVFLSTIGIAGFLVYWVAFSPEPLHEFMRQNALLPFDTSFRIDPDDVGGMWLMVAFMLIGTTGPWASWARPLKMAPLPTHAINGLILATPFVKWALVWLVLLATHTAVIGSVPSTLRPDAFVLFAGLSALANVMVFRHHGLSTVWVMGFIGGLSAGLQRSLSSELTGWGQLAFVVAGLVALGIAAFVNHRTLTRSTSASKAYRAPQAKVEINGPVAPR